MRKEIITYVATNEEDVEVSFQRVADDTNFVLMRLGSFAVAINRHELVEALGTLDQYGSYFDEEKRIKANKILVEKSRIEANLKKSTLTLATPTLKVVKPLGKKVAKEDEDATELHFNNGPTQSELQLQQMMENFNGNAED